MMVHVSRCSANVFVRISRDAGGVAREWLRRALAEAGRTVPSGRLVGHRPAGNTPPVGVQGMLESIWLMRMSVATTRLDATVSR